MSELNDGSGRIAQILMNSSSTFRVWQVDPSSSFSRIHQHVVTRNNCTYSPRDRGSYPSSDYAGARLLEHGPCAQENTMISTNHDCWRRGLSDPPPASTLAGWIDVAVHSDRALWNIRLQSSLIGHSCHEVTLEFAKVEFQQRQLVRRVYISFHLAPVEDTRASLGDHLLSTEDSTSLAFGWKELFNEVVPVSPLLARIAILHRQTSANKISPSLPLVVGLGTPA
ncbi:hypothetical protein ACLMJK_009192 [Lecanora helva]